MISEDDFVKSSMSIFQQIALNLKKASFLVLLIVSSLLIRGQKISNIPILKGDTSSFYLSTRILGQKMELPDLRTSTQPFHFRFWTFGQALDIWVEEKNKLQGQITNYAKVYNKNNKPGEGRIFTNVVPLDVAKLVMVLNLLKQYKINEVPSDNQVPGWKWNMKGWNFGFETNTPKEYTFKSYWTPMAQLDTVKGAEAIRKFTDALLLELNMNAVYVTLTTTLPEGKYTNDGYGILEIKKKDNYR